MYLYRFDLLDRLREQTDDPVLRAKRVKQAQGVFDHFQVINELPSLAPGHGAYRFCFWKTWEAAVRQFPHFDPHSGPWLLQRIRADHPALQRFRRDHDEYLLDDAWIYWQTSRTSDEKPDWSADGIPHTDIEVLHPQGYWEQLATTTMLGEPDLNGWECILHSALHASPSPVYVRSAARYSHREIDAWVLIRQKTGPWISVLNDSAVVEGSIATYFARVAHLDARRTRWALALECSDRVLAFEIFPTFSPSWVPGLLSRLFGRNEQFRPGIKVVADRKNYRHLDDLELHSLYRDFAISDVLRLRERYRYPDGLLSSLSSRPSEPEIRQDQKLKEMHSAPTGRSD